MENSSSSADSFCQGGNLKNVAFMTGRDFNIPHRYGDNKVVLMVRDPWTVFAYWEIKKEVEDNVREEIAKRGLVVSKSTLRVYDVTGLDQNSCSNIVFDFNLTNNAESWYIHGDPEREWAAEVGLLCTNGEFFRLVRSNVVRTPANRVSDILDEEWMCPEELFHKMFATSGEVGKSSQGIRELLERYLRKWLSSGGVSSGMFGSASRKK
jgi:hypothetical protein